MEGTATKLAWLARQGGAEARRPAGRCLASAGGSQRRQHRMTDNRCAYGGRGGRGGPIGLIASVSAALPRPSSDGHRDDITDPVSPAVESVTQCEIKVMCIQWGQTDTALETNEIIRRGLAMSSDSSV
jgi:hypothetical protein